MTQLNVPDSLKMIRETLCIAATAIGQRDFDLHRQRSDIDRISRLIADIDRQRPLSSDGKHGDLHTSTCGCEDVQAPLWRRALSILLGGGSRG